MKQRKYPAARNIGSGYGNRKARIISDIYMTLTSLPNPRSGSALKYARKATEASAYLSQSGLTRIEAKIESVKVSAKVSL